MAFMTDEGVRKAATLGANLTPRNPGKLSGPG